MCIPQWGENNPIPSGLVKFNFVTNRVFFVKGPNADVFDAIISILFDGSFNYSIIQGKYEREGICQNSLHDNQSDFMFMPAGLPVDDELIDIFGVIGQSQMQFMTSYNYTDKSRNADVLDSLTSFEPSLWLLILFLILLFACLLKSKISMTCPQYLRNFTDRLNKVFAHFIGQNSIDDEGIKVLVLTISIFSFLVIQYYNGLIHTDLVIPEVPKVSFSYDDFASTVKVLGFPSRTSMLQYFAQSPEDSPEKRLYNKLRQRNVTIGDGRPLNIPNWATKKLIKKFYNDMYRLSQDHVSIGSEIHLKELLTRTCWTKVYVEDPGLQKRNPLLKNFFSPYFKNLYPWVTSDPRTQQILHAFIKRKHFIPNEKIWKRLKRSVDHGMFERIMLTAKATGSSERMLIHINKRSSQMRDCKQYSRKLKIKEVEFQALKVVNFEKFSLVFFAFISVCCIAYILEVSLKKRHTQVYPM